MTEIIPTIHFIPADDCKEHVGVETCWCIPDTVYFLEHRIIVHNRLNTLEMINEGMKQQMSNN